MAKGSKTAWGIEIGNCTLKAIKLQVDGDHVEVVDFAIIPHDKILSEPDLEPQQKKQMIDTALNRFLEQSETKRSTVVVAVSGQNSFARFTKLPPVETKRIPEIVWFEAKQQIPFDVDDVEWDWQQLIIPDSPEVEVGIFAIKKDLVNQALSPYFEAQCEVDQVQMAPMALYNFISFDRKRLKKSPGKDALIALDIGADNTELVIANGLRVWQRSVPIGGNHFTAAVQKAFKLSFAKAEALKRTASTSKYARQIFQAMRSVFADLAAEVQRSLGFYSSANRDVNFREVLALGNAMKMPGLVKFLQQSLSLPVKRLDSFQTLRLSPDVSVAQFTENLPSLGIVYGLALQGLGKGEIQSNLLPIEVARQRQWRKKRKWFAAALLIFVFSGIFMVIQAKTIQADNRDADKTLSKVKSKTAVIISGSSEKESAVRKVKAANKDAEEILQVYQKRDLVQRVMHAIRNCMPHEANTKDPRQTAIHQAFREADVEGLREIDRADREQVFLTSTKIIYTDDLNQDFKSLESRWGSRRRSTGGQRGMGMGMGMPMGSFMPPGMEEGANFYDQQNQKRKGRKGRKQKSADAKAGFVVILEGYTPHRDNLEFLYPSVEDLNRDEWGFFNRLRYLGKTDKKIREETAKESSQKKLPGATILKKPQAKTNEAKDPVELQSETDTFAENLPIETYILLDEEQREFFDYTESGWVATTKAQNNQPEGIGLEQAKEEKRSAAGASGHAAGKKSPKLPVYIDPLTLEPVSKTYQMDGPRVKYGSDGEPLLQNHDYWFRLKLKLVLKEQPNKK